MPVLLNLNLPSNGSWEEQKIKLKEKFSSITDVDLTFEPGKRAEMMEKLGLKLGKSLEDLQIIISLL
mgnify:CR=1 FL=1